MPLESGDDSISRAAPVVAEWRGSCQHAQAMRMEAGMDGLWYDRDAPKKPTNLTLNQDLVAKAKALGGSLSDRVERLLAAEVEAEARRRADAALDEAIDRSNAFIAKYGHFADEFTEDRYG